MWSFGGGEDSASSLTFAGRRSRGFYEQAKFLICLVECSSCWKDARMTSSFFFLFLLQKLEHTFRLVGLLLLRASRARRSSKFTLNCVIVHKMDA